MSKTVDALVLSAIVFVFGAGYLHILLKAIRETKGRHGKAWFWKFDWGEAIIFGAIAFAIAWGAIESLSFMVR